VSLANRVGLLFLLMLTTCLCSFAQSSVQKQPEQKERKIWIKLKSGEVLSGNLVRMDVKTVDFTVKGVLQSVSCDELFGITFIPPASPTPTPTPTPTPAPTPPRQQEQQAVSLPVQSPVPQPQSPPDRCIRNRSQPITIAGGQYFRTAFGQTLRDFRFRGNFTAHGGKVSVYITDSENFANLMNGKKFYSFYSANKVTDGTFNVPLKAGHYYLVWWNESRFDSRVVEAEVCFASLEQ